MSTDIKITYINNTMNPDKPTIFLFAKNPVPKFDVLKHGVAWRVLAKIGKGSYSEFVYPKTTTVRARWGDGHKTGMLEAEIGKKYTVIENNTGIVIIPNGNAAHPHAIELSSKIKVDGGIRAQLCKDGKVLLEKRTVAYDQKATFILEPKLYWGIAAEIQEGQLIGSAILNSDRFFELDIHGVTHATVTMTGNIKEGYHFHVETLR